MCSLNNLSEPSGSRLLSVRSLQQAVSHLPQPVPSLCVQMPQPFHEEMAWSSPFIPLARSLGPRLVHATVTHMHARVWGLVTDNECIDLARGCTLISITISFSESLWELIRASPPPRKTVGLLSKVKDEASALNQNRPASPPLDFLTKPVAQKKSSLPCGDYGTNASIEMRFLEITSWIGLLKIIKRKRLLFFPQLSNNLFSLKKPLC